MRLAMIMSAAVVQQWGPTQLVMLLGKGAQASFVNLRWLFMWCMHAVWRHCLVLVASCNPMVMVEASLW